MTFLDWTTILPSDFGKQPYDEQYRIVENILKEKNGNWWFGDYPFPEDIRKNDLPGDLLKFLCQLDEEFAIEILKKYNNNEFSILTLDNLDEFSEEFVTCLVNNLNSDDVARALQDYLHYTYDPDDDDGDGLRTVFKSDKLPEDVMELLYEEFIKASDCYAFYGDIAKSPSLKSEKIIRDIVDYFLQLEDNEDNEKYYLCKCLSKNQYLPKDVEALLKKESEKLLR